MTIKKYNPRLRSEEKWDIQFKIALELFNIFDNFEDGYEKEEFAKTLRNPIVHDNNVKEATHKLNYFIQGKKTEKYTFDHLIGMSNIVLYIYERRLYKKWESVDDFKMTLKALSVQLKVPKRVNDSKIFKDWLFNTDDIGNCVLWDIKLKNAGVEYLEDKNGEMIRVEDAWYQWWGEYEEYLI